MFDKVKQAFFFFCIMICEKSRHDQMHISFHMIHHKTAHHCLLSKTGAKGVVSGALLNDLSRALSISYLIFLWVYLTWYFSYQIACAQTNIKHVCNTYLEHTQLEFTCSKLNTRTRCEICSKLTLKIPKRRHWRRSGVFIVNFEYISHVVLVFLLLTLNM